MNHIWWIWKYLSYFNKTGISESKYLFENKEFQLLTWYHIIFWPMILFIFVHQFRKALYLKTISYLKLIIFIFFSYHSKKILVYSRIYVVKECSVRWLLGRWVHGTRQISGTRVRSSVAATQSVPWIMKIFIKIQ